MPDNSAILALPYILPNQAQKHVSHNEALALLDVLVQLSVDGFGASTPPNDPAAGETHALGVSPSGAWAGQSKTLATWRDGVWHFIAPLTGWRAWGRSEAELRTWTGTNWVLPSIETENLDRLGVGTSADATNRLSVKADATLLSHDGTNHQLKINKSSGADIASVLFQSGWTGHAELGLSGGKDFSIKVSDDGSNWSDALNIDRVNGNVGIGTGTPTEALDVKSDAIRIRSSQTPGSSSANGSKGQICWDAGHVYVCTATDTWKRAALSSW